MMPFPCKDQDFSSSLSTKMKYLYTEEVAEHGDNKTPIPV
jgi:hypothetical protein